MHPRLKPLADILDAAQRRISGIEVQAVTEQKTDISGFSAETLSASAWRARALLLQSSFQRAKPLLLCFYLDRHVAANGRLRVIQTRDFVPRSCAKPAKLFLAKTGEFIRLIHFPHLRPHCPVTAELADVRNEI
jgi:hypothetical protein